MKTVAYNNDKAKCPKCKEMIVYDGTMVRNLPLGFGFAPGSAVFRVDVLVQKGFAGECMDCGLKIFAVKSTRASIRHPRSINKELRLDRATPEIA